VDSSGSGCGPVAGSCKQGNEPYYNVRFQVLTAVSMKFRGFWAVAPCSYVEVGSFQRDYTTLHPRRLEPYYKDHEFSDQLDETVSLSRRITFMELAEHKLLQGPVHCAYCTSQDNVGYQCCVQSSGVETPRWPPCTLRQQKEQVLEAVSFLLPPPLLHNNTMNVRTFYTKTGICPPAACLASEDKFWEGGSGDQNANMSLNSDISGPHGGEYEDHSVLGCCAV
jgi:hypothetical protein